MLLQSPPPPHAQLNNRATHPALNTTTRRSTIFRSLFSARYAFVLTLLSLCAITTISFSACTKPKLVGTSACTKPKLVGTSACTKPKLVGTTWEVRDSEFGYIHGLEFQSPTEGEVYVIANGEKEARKFTYSLQGNEGSITFKIPIDGKEEERTTPFLINGKQLYEYHDNSKTHATIYTRK